MLSTATATATPRPYLALGDSYTIGEGVAAADCWPQQLVHALAQRGIRLDGPEVLATTGWSTDELLAALPEHQFTPPYALVSLLIGVNNQYRGRDAVNYREELLQLLRFAVTMAGERPSRVMLVSIPDWGVTPLAAREDRDATQVAAAIDAFNAVAREEATASGCRFVDITTISRACGADPTMLMADGLHPSAAQYQRWLPMLVAAAAECLAAA